MIKNVDMEMTVMKEVCYTHRSLETGDVAYHEGLHREALGLLRRQRG